MHLRLPSFARKGLVMAPQGGVVKMVVMVEMEEVAAPEAMLH